MILKKVTVDGKETYVPIDMAQALRCKATEALIFTDEDEKDALADLEEKLMDVRDLLGPIDPKTSKSRQELEEARQELSQIMDELGDIQTMEPLEGVMDRLDELEDHLSDLEDEVEDELEDEQERPDLGSQIHIRINGKDFGKRIKTAFGDLFGKRSDPKLSKLIGALPFMDKADLHELVDKLLAGDPACKDLDLVTIMPFLDARDCDALFMRCLEGGLDEKGGLTAMAPFVSKECLSAFVEGYVSGKYQDVEINTLYPFLDSKDVKKVFQYILEKERS